MGGSNPNDGDSDDDGVADGAEANAWFDTDGDGRLNVNDADSDGDLILDGTEAGVTAPHVDTDPSTGLFRTDADTSTRTSPVNPDSDGGGRLDGDEDVDRDGAVDRGECDPTDPADDLDTSCGVVPPPTIPEEEGEATPPARLLGGGGWACASSTPGEGRLPATLLVLAWVAGIRRRRARRTCRPD